MHDYFSKNPDRRRDVLSPAERVGHTADLPAHVNLAKADLQTASFTQFSFAHALLIVNGDAPKRPKFDAAVHAQAAALDMALDAGGHLARKSLLPPLMGA